VVNFLIWGQSLIENKKMIKRWHLWTGILKALTQASIWICQGIVTMNNLKNLKGLSTLKWSQKTKKMIKPKSYLKENLINQEPPFDQSILTSLTTTLLNLEEVQGAKEERSLFYFLYPLLLVLELQFRIIFNVLLAFIWNIKPLLMLTAWKLKMVAEQVLKVDKEVD